MFEIDSLPHSAKFLKMIVEENFGAQKTYINQVFLR
jgi:hypothetical protein